MSSRGLYGFPDLAYTVDRARMPFQLGADFNLLLEAIKSRERGHRYVAVL